MQALHSSTPELSVAVYFWGFELTLQPHFNTEINSVKALMRTTYETASLLKQKNILLVAKGLSGKGEYEELLDLLGIIKTMAASGMKLAILVDDEVYQDPLTRKYQETLNQLKLPLLYFHHRDEALRYLASSLGKSWMSFA
jgi:hypothetical protein